MTEISLKIQKLLAEKEPGYWLDDADYGCPTEEALWVIQNWTHELPVNELFDFIRPMWHLPTFGWYEFTDDEGNTQYNLSTAG